MTRRLLLLALLATAVSSCATVKKSWVRDDFETADRTQTLRLVVVTAPLPSGNATAGELWSLVARRYVNQKRDYIAREHLASEVLPADACGEGLEGILLLVPEARQVGKGFEVEVAASLTRCRDGEKVWTAEAGGTWPSDDAKLAELRASYEEELGAEVGPWVAPTFHLLRATLDTLPEPELATDDDVMEKIELGE